MSVFNVFADDGTLGSEADTGQFWVLFGGHAPLPKKAHADDAPEVAKPTLFWYVKRFPLSLNSRT